MSEEPIESLHRAMADSALNKHRGAFLWSTVVVGVLIALCSAILGAFVANSLVATIISAAIMVVAFLCCWAYAGAARAFKRQQIVIRSLRANLASKDALLRMEYEQRIIMVRGDLEMELRLQRRSAEMTSVSIAMQHSEIKRLQQRIDLQDEEIRKWRENSASS